MQRVNLIFQYISYKLFARHRHGHGIHSPFIYDLIRKVFNQRNECPAFRNIERIRNQYLSSNESIAVTGYGAGSRTIKKDVNKLKKIVRSSAIKARYGRMLHNLVNFYHPESILELGTSAGISTAYLATADPITTVYTVDGDRNISQIAGCLFDELKLRNIEQITDTFENALEYLLKRISGKLLVFIDGNHQYHAVLDYLMKLKTYADECLIIFDDIRWSDSMLKAWKAIRSDPGVSISLDLFFMGIILLNTDIPKQHFVIKY